MQLVDDAKNWLRMYSNQVFLFISVMGVVQVWWPYLSWAFPSWIVGVVFIAIGAAGVLARLVKQWDIQPAAV